jgi:dTDP-4-amino-4,6-dideoxygalactose transaminase
VERVYFEFLVRDDRGDDGLPLPALVKALQAEGALVAAPRYPLLHQQPVFTDGTWARIARLDPDVHGPLPVYDPAALPRTTAGNARLVRLPTFPQADDALVDQYAHAFEKVLARRDEIPVEAT